jgi:hypothetical protein
LKYVLLGRIRYIPKSETFNSCTGLPPWWSEALFVCVLQPVLARGLPSWASGLTWVVLCVSQLALTAPFFSGSACFNALPALPNGKVYIGACFLHLGNIAEIKEK